MIDGGARRAGPSRPAVGRVATYRLQLTPDFGFDDAVPILDDLARLGVSLLYLSPVAAAVTGSTHGYDVVDPTTVRPELGGREGLWRLGRAARERGLGMIVDIVPNHVSTAVPEQNPWWWSVLEQGPDSAVADHFDIDWAEGDGKVILPVLAEPLASAIAAGRIVVEDDRVHYADMALPLAVGHPAEGSRPGAPDTADSGTVLAAQHYRLQHWRDPRRNVRRFFTIDDLVAIRPEVPAVVGAVHRIVRDLATDGLIDGVRVDHIDGLADPIGYLSELRALLGDERLLFVEKILVGAERLDPSWPVDGTTGYDWIGLVDHLFTDPAGEASFTDVWREATGDTRSYHEHEVAGMREVLGSGLRPDLERLARCAAGELDGRADPGAAPTDWRDLVEPLAELTVQLGQYRTYLSESTNTHSDADVERVERASRTAGQRLEEDAATALEQLVELVLSGTELTRRWQQLSGPVMAKGGEDRALYRWARMVAHNEVGGDPDRWSTALTGFHEWCAAQATRGSSTLLAGSTHDTKRSEDVRARLLALTGRPERWRAAVADWTAEVRNRGHAVAAVSAASRLLAFQTAIGAWPIRAERLGDYLVKASREADVSTSWTDPDDDYELALYELAGLLTEGPIAPGVERLVAELEPAARAIASAQLVLRMTAPGIPDFYQGSESWLFTLVDPDNRRPLDTGALHADAQAATSQGSVWSRQRTKGALIGRVLSLRHSRHTCFESGSRYEPLPAHGTFADHVIAFRRRPVEGGAPGVITVAARHPWARPDGWADTAVALPHGRWWDVLSGRELDVDDHAPIVALLGPDPAALLDSRA